MSIDVGAAAISLDFRDPDFVTAITAADASRLATACVQSASISIGDQDEKYWLPWSLVRLYYAAFYGAHTIVRLLGTGCCWLESTDVLHLDALWRTTTGQPPPIQIGKGTYCCHIDSVVGALRWTRNQSRPHEALWAIFDGVLDSTSGKVLAGGLPQRDAQAVFAKLQSFRDLSAKNGTASWLSRTRNDIQYKLANGVWHPVELSRKRRDGIARHADMWTVDPMNIDLAAVRSADLLTQFSVACAFVISVCRMLVLRIDERTTGARSFLSYGPIGYANAARIDF
ncbi:MAG: hypothetical protein LT103_04695 [Burkholderiaceae bacterium]|nr:hypothetical protein [Burkholderiaceae bacterium]